MSFHESARRGEIINLFQYAIVNGALWAIGISWSTAIRQIVVTILPDTSNERVLAEMAAALLTTTLGVGVAFFATRNCASCLTPSVAPHSTETRRAPSSTTLATRRF